MKRTVPFAIALAVLGALVLWVSQTGGLPEPLGASVGQFLSRVVNFVFLLGCGAFLLFGPLRARESRAFRVAWTAGAVLLHFAVVGIIKHFVFWPRPIDAGHTAENAVRGSGFPSGHTLPAFLFASLVGFIEPRLRIPALATAILIGYSRVEVLAHFAIQVWVSALMGLALGALWSRVLPREKSVETGDAPPLARP